MVVESFGHAPDGALVERVAISTDGLSANVITLGAAIQDLRLEGHGAPLVLGFDRCEDYIDRSPYFGATVGRYANRIGGARFEIDGRTYQTDPNFLGKHTLHGGAQGAGRLLWRIVEAESDRVTLTCRLSDGAMGFPGALDVACTYAVAPKGRLLITLSATTDAPTLCNFAHHSYFNLKDGGRTAAHDHELQINAGAYLPVDDELIPTGRIAPVDGTDFDFRSLRSIKDPDSRPSYDHNFCLSEARTNFRKVAKARSSESGVTMDVWTTEPGLQFYDGANVGRDAPGLGGVTYANYAGFCLEPQVWPDSPNQPAFPQAVLRPGEFYEQVSAYCFSLGDGA